MTETPKYSVIKKQKEIELRLYPATIRAEVSVSGTDYKSAANRGFEYLAGYIFGNNTARQKVDMTAPVQISRSEKIAMTAPVIVSGQGEYSVAFIMPAGYSLESLPIPNDKKVRLVPLPACQMAAIRFSGFFNQGVIEANKLKLTAWMEQEKLESEGDFVIAGYDPPWVPGFLARNEILIKIRT